MGLDPTVFNLVSKPAHYNTGGIECIDYLEDNLPPEAFRGYLEGNVKKYLHRWRYKNGLQDLQKAVWYLNELVHRVKALEDKETQ